jgi:hypothetical protein
VLNNKEDQMLFVLNWQVANKEEFPCIFAIASNFLLILGLEVNVKRLFNLARDILGLRRTLIGLETIRALILVKDFLCQKRIS